MKVLGNDMIIHIALYAWKQESTTEAIDRAIAEVRALKKKVPGLIDVRCGKNYSKWNEGYTHAFVVLAKDQKALDDYRNHPDHVKVAGIIDKMESKSIGIDFED